jgi:O-acetylserine/cysteine efflux transporter
MTARLPLNHFLLAMLVVAIWGSNFVIIRFGLESLPPLLLFLSLLFEGLEPAVAATPAAVWR